MKTQDMWVSRATTGAGALEYDAGWLRNRTLSPSVGAARSQGDLPASGSVCKGSIVENLIRSIQSSLMLIKIGPGPGDSISSETEGTGHASSPGIQRR
ncbi:hypothetical protein [Bradyrhizobium sediminis]|uniref:hypothetical protein n=1 Tax=Bradyrhizobium sediminis TaxID=2840469 RepID=UPI00201BF09A|nr:hypothetical protein [Bradyrhizobium sediminis]